MHRVPFVLLLAALGVPSTIAAQAPAQSTADAPLRRLQPLVGDWTMASLPSDVTLRETCEWFIGERHVVCQMRSRSPSWRRGVLTMFGYDPTDSTYAMTTFGSGGQMSVARGRARGDTLVFDGELRTGQAAPRRTLVTIVPRADGFDLTEQEADGAGGWKSAARIRYVPAVPAPR